MKYKPYNEVMPWRYDSARCLYITEALRFFKDAFMIESLEDNHRPYHNEDYITYNRENESLTIKSVFDDDKDYTLEDFERDYMTLSNEEYLDTLRQVYDLEIKHLKTSIRDIGVLHYLRPNFKSWRVNLDVYEGMLTIAVETKDVPGEPLARNMKVTLEEIARFGIFKIVDEVFTQITRELIGAIAEKRGLSSVTTGKLLRMEQPMRYYVHEALKVLKDAFCIESLESNTRPSDGKDYITYDDKDDSLRINPLFDLTKDYVIVGYGKRFGAHIDKLMDVYNLEAEYLKSRFIKIGQEYYLSREVKDYRLDINVDQGILTVFVEIRDFNPESPWVSRTKMSLSDIAHSAVRAGVAHNIFRRIVLEYKDYVEGERKTLYSQINETFGVPKEVLDKVGNETYEHNMAAIKRTLNGIYGRGGFTMRDYSRYYNKAIKKVIFNDPATIVMWNDGSKTVVKKHGDVEFNGEAAVMYAYVLRWVFDNNRRSMRIWLNQNSKRYEWQSEKPKKIEVKRTSKGKITKASQREVYDAMTPEQKEVVDAMIQDAVKESKKSSNGGNNDAN